MVLYPMKHSTWNKKRWRIPNSIHSASGRMKGIPVATKRGAPRKNAGRRRKRSKVPNSILSTSAK